MILEVVLLSFIIALVRKGKFSNILSYGIKFKIFFLLYIIVQLGIVFFGNKLPGQILDYDMFIYLFSYLLLMAFLVRNLGKYEYIIILIGVFLNFAVTFINGGKMPLSLDAAAAAGLSGSAFLEKMSMISAAMTSGTKLSILADFIPMPAVYPLSIVLSPGDIIICIGAFIAVQRMFTINNTPLLLSPRAEIQREENYFKNDIPLVDINEFFNQDPKDIRSGLQDESNAISSLVAEMKQESMAEKADINSDENNDLLINLDEKENEINIDEPSYDNNEIESVLEKEQQPDELNVKLGDTTGVEQGQITFLDPEISKYVDLLDANEPKVKKIENENKEQKIIRHYPDIGEELRKQKEIERQNKLAAQSRQEAENESTEILLKELAKSIDENDSDDQEKTRQLTTRHSAKAILRALKDGESFEYNKDKYTITIKDDDVPIGERKESFLKRLKEYDIDIRKTQAATTEEKEQIELEIKREKGINVDDMFIVQDGKFIENPNYKHRKKK